MLASLLLWHRAGGEFVAFARRRPRRGDTQAPDDVRAAHQGRGVGSDRPAAHCSAWPARAPAPRSRLHSAMRQTRDTGSRSTTSTSSPPPTAAFWFARRPGTPRRCTAGWRRRMRRRTIGTGSGYDAGVPTITRATQDLFVPQTTNFDLVGGIQFPQGLLPGPGNRRAHAVSRPPEGAPVRVPRRFAPRRHRQRRSSPKARTAPPARSSTPRSAPGGGSDLLAVCLVGRGRGRRSSPWGSRRPATRGARTSLRSAPASRRRAG